jgi:phage tail sheath gpL-like
MSVTRLLHLADPSFYRYISASVTDDEEINAVMAFIVKDSGTESMDVCVAAAGVLGTFDALDYPVEDFKKVSVADNEKKVPFSNYHDRSLT